MARSHDIICMVRIYFRVGTDDKQAPFVDVEYESDEDPHDGKGVHHDIDLVKGNFSTLGLIIITI